MGVDKLSTLNTNYINIAYVPTIQNAQKVTKHLTLVAITTNLVALTTICTRLMIFSQLFLPTFDDVIALHHKLAIILRGFVHDRHF